MKIFREAKGIPEPPEEENIKETVLGSINVTLSDESKTSEERTAELETESPEDTEKPENPENTEEGAPKEKWMPPPPGPDRDRDGTPRGRFSDTPFN